jgi:hypothetical protein
MEIKVFKDTSKRESVTAGLTGPQWLLILGISSFLILDILNAVFQVIPVWIVRVTFFPVLGLLAGIALFRPHGMSFFTWLKLYFKFNTTIQTRTYKKEGERNKKYEPKDFKKTKAFKETKRSKTKHSSR